MEIKVVKEFNGPKLMDELLNVNLIQPTRPDGASSMQGNTIYVDDDANINAIQSVINAHDVTPLPSPLSAMEILREELAATASAVDFLLMNLMI